MRRLRALADAAGETAPALRSVQLMLEDYRTSVFAPELGVPTRISADDIDAALSALEGDA